MNTDTDTLAHEGLPVFLDQTEEILKWLRERSRDELQSLWGCNDKIAEQNYRRIEETRKAAWYKEIKEELLMNEEGLRKTANKLIYIGKQIELDEFDFICQLRELRDAARLNDVSGSLKALHKIVPTFVTSEEFNGKILMTHKKEKLKMMG